MLGGDGLVQLFEAGVLRGEAALAGRVDDEDDFAFVFGEGVVGAGFWSEVGWLVSGGLFTTNYAAGGRRRRRMRRTGDELSLTVKSKKVLLEAMVAESCWLLEEWKAIGDGC